MKKFIFALAFTLTAIIAIAQTTFKPTKAVLNDSEGEFSSESFDCPSMVVYDYVSYVEIKHGGESIKLRRNSNNDDVYEAQQSSRGTTIRYVAYRSSNTGKIYLVICSTKRPNDRLDILFKP